MSEVKRKLQNIEYKLIFMEGRKERRKGEKGYLSVYEHVCKCLEKFLNRH